MKKDKKQYVLVKWSDNWADEMDLEGFKTYKKSEWESIESKLKSYNECFSICVGTNEDIEYENGKALLDVIEVIELSEAVYKTIDKLFNGEYGTTNAFDYNPCCEEEEEYEEE